MTTFIHANGNWTDIVAKFNLGPEDIIDFHFGPRDGSVKTYDEAMFEVKERVVAGVQNAQQRGRHYVMFVHGHSTSGPGKTTARSVVRQFMRSREATPYIERRGCVQHETVFLAKIKKRVGSASEAQ